MDNIYTKTGSKGVFISKSVLMFCMAFLFSTQNIFAAQITASAVEPTLRGQNDMVSVHFVNEPLSDVLHDLTRKVRVGISYKTEVMPDKKITYEAKYASIYTVLDAVLAGTGLQATLSKDRKVILIKKKPVQKDIQQSTITGTVTDAGTGEALPGVNILVIGTTTGTTTDANGKYELNVESLQDTLRFSFIGYQTRKIPVNGRTTINVKLKATTTGLEEMVVTALGQKREKRSVGYSSQNISSKEINASTGISEGLQGKVSGAQVTSASGTIGSSNRIVLRGNSSISGDNQPLYIVDGVYIDNSNFDAPDGNKDIADYGNAAMDIDPGDIKSINILKGPNAAALYGSRAANGAIVITTKDGSGKEGVQVNVSSSVKFSNPWILPDMQNQYGQGYGGKFEYVDGRGGGVNDGTDASWGPPLDGRLLKQWWSPNKAVPWEPHPNNVRNFFVTGNTISNNVSIAGNNEKINYRLSVSNGHQKGMYPNVSSDKNDIKMNVGADITNRFHLNIRANYINYIARNMPDVGYAYPGNPLMGLIQWAPRQLRMDKLKEAYENNPDPYTAPPDWNNIFFDNQYWVMYQDTKRQDRNRVIGGIDITYNFMDWLSLKGRAGIDWYLEQRNKRVAYGSISDSDGSYQETNRHVKDPNYSLEMNANRDLNEDFSLSARIGGELVQNYYQLNGASTSALEVPGVYALTNSAVQPTMLDESTSKEVYSAYGSTTMSFKEYLYLDLTGRNDWSSTLPENNNSYFYPSASLSYIFTDAMNIKADWFDYGKVRASWTKVGNDTKPYQLQSTFNSGNPILGEVPNYWASTTIFNKNLKPEKTKSWEFGTNLKFFHSRLTFDFTYYKSTTEDQIISVPVSDGTGYSTKIINAGSIKNQGIELTFGGTPIQTSNWQWNINVNFAKNSNQVEKLAPGINSYIIDQDFGATLEARPGDEIGSIYGPGFLRDDQGNIVVDKQGIPMADQTIQNWGSYAPDWTAGITSDITWRNLRFSFLIDIKQGGTISSGSIVDGRQQGTYKETAKGRDGMIFDGGRWANGAVKQDGTRNDISIKKQDLNQFYGRTVESHVWDASYIKLRNLRLTYSVPASFLRRLGPIEGIDISLMGNNVWMIHKNIPHIDPETMFSSTRIPGLESQTAPKARSYGFNINFKF